MRNTVLLPSLALVAACASISSAPVHGSDDLGLWREFRDDFRAGRITSDRIRPYLEQLRQPLLRFVEGLRKGTKEEDWEAAPEIFRVDKQVHFLIPLAMGNGPKTTYCFTILEEGDSWYFQHMESIFLRLDEIGPLPTTRFPDLPEAQKTWMREENAWTDRLRVFKMLTELQGKPYAVQWLEREAAGYFLAARTWVPFVRPERAFVLYSCWEQSNLRGSPVTLEKLDDDQAVFTVDSIEWRLYEQTAHLRLILPREDFTAVYETVWRSRARAAGWDAQFTYDALRCTLRLRRGSPSAIGG